MKRAVVLAAALVAATAGAGPERQAAYTGRLVAAGVVEGLVRLRYAELPSPTRVRNTTDPEVCGPEHSLEDLVVSAGSRALRNVVVALTGVPAEAAAARRPGRLVIDNRGCRFDPHVAVAMPGDTIVARNSDPTLHTTHFYGALRGNLSLPRQGMEVRRLAQRPGAISILCDVHGWMKAYILVHDHPFHDVTDETGAFRIEAVPAGDYTLDAWHETLGNQQLQVRVENGRTTRVELEYQR